tara:strand:- start:681 stop:3254 length:2574 start_codon:yes stop_codon:yes gene_type:complete
MALQSRTITVGADKDVNNGGKNYVSGQVIYIKNEAGVLAPIFRDIDGLDPISQNTISNVTNAKGQFTFFIEEGNYIAEYNDQSTPLFVFGADYFNNQIDFVTNQILSNTQPYSAGNFTDGFTFTELNQYGNATVNDGGADYATTFWYIGGTLPHIVAPLTDPRNFPLLYQQRDFNSAEFVATKTTENTQDFIDSFALKIFQSPTDGLTEINTRTLLGGEVYEVRKVSDGNYADIYTDKEGSNPIAQDGFSNVSGSDGVVVFYIDDGRYSLTAGLESEILSVSFTKQSSDIKLLGGVGDGVIDNQTVLSLDTPFIDVYDGDYSINTSTTITADLHIKPDAVLIANNCNVTIAGDIVAGNQKCLAEVGTGRFLLAQGAKLDEVKTHWYGVTLNDPTPAVADDNARALFSSVRFAGSLGIPNGLYNNKAARPPSGLLYVDDHDSDGVICPIPSYTQVFGYGENTVIRPVDGAKACDVFAVLEDGSNSWAIDNLMIYGEASEQVNTQNAIAIRPTGAAANYGYVGSNVYIKEMKGNGIKITEKGVINCEIKPKLVRDCEGHNMYVSAAVSTVFDGKYRSSKAGFWGAVFDGPNVRKNEINGRYDENNEGGLFLTNTGERNEINASCSNNFQGDGCFLDRADDTVIKYLFTEQNAERGLVTSDCDNLSSEGVVARSNGHSGVEHYSLNNSNLTNTTSYGNGSAANNTYLNFLLSGDSDNNHIDGLFCRGGAGVNKVKHNLQIDNQCNENLFSSVDIRGGAVTSDKLDNGIDTKGLDLEFTQVWDPVSIAAGGLTSITVSADKSNVGDGVDIVKFSLPLQGLILTAWVSSVNTVTVQLYNPTASAVDLASGSVTVVVDKSIRQ